MKKIRKVKESISLDVVDDGSIYVIRKGEFVLFKNEIPFFKTSSEKHSNFTGAYIESLDGEIKAVVNLRMLS